MEFKGANILSVEQFNREDIRTILQVAETMEPYALPQKKTRVLEGAILGNLFFEASTRTRLSFGSAFNRLGGSVRDVVGFQFSSMAKGESIYDTSRVISGYVDILVVRHPQEGSVLKFAQATNIPVINGGDGAGEHPTQALLDIYTVYKEKEKNFDKLNGLKIGMIGDLKHGRTVHSFSKLLSLFEEMKFIFVAPEQIQMPDKIVNQIKNAGHAVIQTDKLIEGISDVDIIYVTRMQEERFDEKENFSSYQGYYTINKQIYDKYCHPQTIIMHPLPRDSRPQSNELDNNLNNYKNLAIFRQTYNGVPVRMALFALLLGVVDKVQEIESNVQWYVPTPIG